MAESESIVFPAIPEVRRTALVTGGVRGIGAAITDELRTRGCHVAVGYHRSGDRAHALQNASDETILGVPYELANAESAENAIAAVHRHWGGLNSLVVNAGIWAGGRLDELAPEQWWSIVDTNVRGMAQVVRAALPVLREGPNPSVVILSSVVGLVGFAGDTAYASAKSAMIGFARSLAKESARDGIRVNVVAPGFVETDMTGDVSDRARQRIEHDTALRRFGTSEEIARAVTFLSEDATYCTGTVLTVDGGWSL